MPNTRIKSICIFHTFHQRMSCEWNWYRMQYLFYLFFFFLYVVISSLLNSDGLERTITRSNVIDSLRTKDELTKKNIFFFSQTVKHMNKSHKTTRNDSCQECVMTNVENGIQIVHFYRTSMINGWPYRFIVKKWKF